MSNVIRVNFPNVSHLQSATKLVGGGGAGVLLKILGRGVPPVSQNPDSVGHKKMSVSTPVFRPDL